jgi:hypothetical protein
MESQSPSCRVVFAERALSLVSLFLDLHTSGLKED